MASSLPMFDLTGKTALVTGAATGLGQAAAVALARQGATVLLSDKPEISLQQSRDRITTINAPQPAVFALDVREQDHIQAVSAEILSRFGRVDILVNNAGINRPAEALHTTPNEWEDHYQTNVRGGFFLAQALAPAMIEAAWGRVIWISSQSGLVGIPGQSVYCSSKGAVIQLVRTLGVEWARHGITVNTVAPTFVETDLTRQRLQQPEFRDFVLKKIPAGKLATPEHVAAAVVFLASEEAAMVNAHTLCVDGGWTAW